MQYSRLTAGLKLLHQADPCIEIALKETGENIVIAAGEMHLEVSFGIFHQLAVLILLRDVLPI